MQTTISAQEARERTVAGLKRARRNQIEEIMAGIQAIVNSPHPRYYFVYDGFIEPDVKEELINRHGYKILPPLIHGGECTTQIEW